MSLDLRNENWIWWQPLLKVSRCRGTEIAYLVSYAYCLQYFSDWACCKILLHIYHNQLRFKEREELALKTDFNALKQKYDIIFKEKDFFEKQAKMMTDNYKRSEEKIMQQKIDIHNEKRKNEFLSRRL